MNKLYFLIKTTDYIYKIPSIQIFFGIYGWSAVSIDETDYELILKFDIKYYELTKSDIMGFKYFGSGKSTVSVSIFDENEDINFDDYEISKNKVKIPVTQERYDSIVKSMKLFAKVLLEEEFDRRFNKFRYNSSFLESQTWEKQVEEVKKYHNNEDTPLLNSIVETKKISINELVSLIENKISEYELAIQDLYVQLIRLKTEFNNCAIIEDLNVLYAKYFGQFFYISEEYKKSNPEIFDENGQFKFKVPTSYNF
jgi:hypothetical protein